MAADDSTAAAVVPAAEIARLAGVTRAAVSNWRRRYADFPKAAGGTATSPLFALSEIQRWLDQQGKGQQVAGEVDLWTELRSQYGDNLIAALRAVGAHLLGVDVDQPLAEGAAGVVAALAEDRGPQALFAGLVDRCIVSTGRNGGDPMSTPRLARIVSEFAGKANGVVYDPACGLGTLLLAVGTSVVGTAQRYGQELNPATAVIADLRAQLNGTPLAAVGLGDSLREDLFTDLRADLVVCEPPVGTVDWGRDALLLDARWDLGVPPRSEGELAWLQHCYAHTAPGGRVLIVMPASVAYRKAGRRIRAELVRRGLLTDVVALPSGLIANHTLPVHLWILRRPVTASDAAQHIRMVDLSAADPDVEVTLSPGQTTNVPLVDVLDEDVDLSPGRYVAAEHGNYPAEYATARCELQRLVQELLDMLPELPAGPGRLEAAPVGLGDLVRGGLVELNGTVPASRTEQLDTDYLRGFLRSAANTRRSTTASGSFRLDLRSTQVPQMDLARQRDYGAAFRRLSAFEERLREASAVGSRAAALAFDGLTNGALLPSATSEPPETAAQEEQEQ